MPRESQIQKRESMFWQSVRKNNLQVNGCFLPHKTTRNVRVPEGTISQQILQILQRYTTDPVKWHDDVDFADDTALAGMNWVFLCIFQCDEVLMMKPSHVLHFFQSYLFIFYGMTLYAFQCKLSPAIVFHKVHKTETTAMSRTKKTVLKKRSSSSIGSATG